MKNLILKTTVLYFLIYLSLNAQTFTTSPFITLPGNNSNFDVLYFGPSGAYLCWLNVNNAIYSIYFRRTEPDSSKNIIIYSGTQQISNPKIATMDNTSNIRIVWQMMDNNHWQILSRELINDSLSNIIDITDSLSDNITPTISATRVAWINNGNLYYKNFDSISNPPSKLDSLYCSNPDLIKSDNTGFSEITYVKGQQFEKQIYLISYSDYKNPQWEYQRISNGSDNINPYFTFAGSLSFQTMISFKWHCVFNSGDTTKNISYNCENSDVLKYPVPVNGTGNYTPFFVVYDSDSLSSNREILLQTLDVSGKVINISNSSGDDYDPKITMYQPGDTVYLAILWIHNENGKQDIWMAKTPFNPLTRVEPIQNQISIFHLYQNYPNPFNPSTVISYQLSAFSHVTIRVYDVLGREVAELVNDKKPAGTYKVEFNASNLSSGVYFYQLKAMPQNGGSAGEFVDTKKLLLLK